MVYTRRHTRLILAVGSLALILIGLLFSWELAAAQPARPGPTTAQTQPGVDNETCFACHAAPGMELSLPSGETLILTVEPETYNNSVHGAKGYGCIQCHTDIRGYPHPPITAETRREYTLETYQACARCHQDKHDATQQGAHGIALEAGNENAAVCTDCHGAHNVQPLDQPRSLIPQTCERCHSQIYDLYEDSVHGQALIGEGNPDVPDCTSCHGVHDISGPSHEAFRVFSPEICARCHADQELMAQYGISTEVFDTYVADFHGTTVALFEKITPDQETNKPVCVDCHGVHNMRKVDDPESQVIKQNLLDTCQKCHPGASANFPSAWLSHYRPSPTRHPTVYFVDLFYKIFIPTVLGGMAVFVVLDGSRRIINRFKGRNDEHEQ